MLYEVITGDLDQFTEHQTEHNRRRRKTVVLHLVADQAVDQHDPDVGHVVLQGIGADHAEDQSYNFV